MEPLDPLQRHLYYERYVNECERNASRLSGGFDRQYQFNSETPSFELICHEVPRDQVVLILNDPSEEVRRDFLLDDKVKFCLHPQFKDRTDISCMADLAPHKSLSGVEVSPTSSMRTVLVKGKRYAVKLHSPILVSNFHRTMGLKTIIHSMEVSRILEGMNHPRFAVLPETLGLAFPREEGKRSWGFLVREMTPRPYVEGSEKRLLIPCFALFHKSKHHPERQPLLIDLIERSSKSPADFVLEEIILPIVEYWVCALRDEGILIGPHGQNALLEVEPDLSKIYRIVIRDFDVHIHDEIRKRKGLSLDNFDPGNLIGREGNTYPFGAEVSLMYDITICKLLFTPLVEEMRIRYGVDPAFFQGRCREFIREQLPNYKELFPSVSYKMAIVEKADSNEHNILVDSEQIYWRPSMERDSIETHLYYERYVGIGTPNYQNNAFDPQYHSTSDTQTVPMMCFKVPATAVNFHTSSPDPEVLKDFLFPDGDLKVCLHPQFKDYEFASILSQYQRLPDEEVIPTSSTRTVFVKGKKYAVKLHSPLKIANYYRTIGAAAVKHAIQISEILRTIPRSDFGYLRETIGIAFPAQDGKRSWGFMVREMTPYPDDGKKKTTIPYFALYGKDKFDLEKRVLLAEIIDRSKEDPIEFVLTKFMFPLIKCWIELLTTQGLLLEPHGQNALFELDEEMNVHRFIFRDLDLKVDVPTRTRLGLSIDNLHPYLLVRGPTEHRPFGSEASLKYDRTAGKFVFDRLAAEMEKYYGTPPEALKERCRAFFLDRFPHYREYFSELAYLVTGVEIERNFIEVATFTPEWRPV